MGTIRKVKLSNDYCNQEAKRVSEELEILMYALDLENVEKEHWNKEIFDRASGSLKIFMVRNLSKEKNIEELRKMLLLRVREEKEIRAKEYQGLTEKVLSTVRGVMSMYKREGRGAVVKCFYCDKPGHVTRNCFLRKAKEGYNYNNKNDLKYFNFSGENDTDSATIYERGYKKTYK